MSTNKQYYPGETRRFPLAAQSTPEAWAQQSHDILLASEHERMASQNLCALTDNISSDICKDITQRKDIVNTEFQKNLDKLESDRVRLSELLKKVSETT
ncbi:unnamed protein product [Protopolystoma xenopodis]|uniref:Uncharacterized protein n=1 Tax=Protopolystoma xenopodis TaxID=117903 RepID=A0A3S5AKE0_9PLAT|nr:unnamed protein product [Protopolystoma xenopodis]